MSMLKYKKQQLVAFCLVSGVLVSALILAKIQHQTGEISEAKIDLGGDVFILTPHDARLLCSLVDNNDPELRALVRRKIQETIAAYESFNAIAEIKVLQECVRQAEL